MATGDGAIPTMLKEEEPEQAPNSSARSTSSDVSLPSPTGYLQAEPGADDTGREPTGEETLEAVAPRTKRRSGPRSKTSSYLGVTKYKRTGKWECHVWCSESSLPTSKGNHRSMSAERAGKKLKLKRGSQLHVGSFFRAEDAARGYDRAAFKLRGADASLNFPDTDYSQDWFYKAFGHLDGRDYVGRLRQWAQELDAPSEEGAYAPGDSEPSISCPSVIAWQRRLQQRYTAMPRSRTAGAEESEARPDAPQPTRRSARTSQRRRLPLGWTYDGQSSELSDDEDRKPGSFHAGSHQPSKLPTSLDPSKLSRRPRKAQKVVAHNGFMGFAPWPHRAEGRGLQESGGAQVVPMQVVQEDQGAVQPPVGSPEGPAESPSSPHEWFDATEHLPSSPESRLREAPATPVSGPGGFLLNIAKCAMEAPALFGSLLSRSAATEANGSLPPVQPGATSVESA